MSTVNKVFIVGRLGKEVELRYTPSQTAVAELSVATSSKEGEREHTEWHTVTVFGKTAEACSNYLAKGSLVAVEGSIKTETWEDKKTREKRYRTKIKGDHVTFLSKKGEGGGVEKSHNSYGHDESIPF